MVEHDIYAQCLHDLIEALGGKALEEGIRIALAAHAVHDIVALVIVIDHLIHRVDIVLKVCVHGDDHVRVIDRSQQTRQQRVLMAAVAGKVDAGEHIRFLLVKLADDLPGIIAGAVVDEHHAALFADFAFALELIHLLAQALARFRQNLLLLITGNDDVKRILLIHRFLLFPLTPACSCPASAACRAEPPVR